MSLSLAGVCAAGESQRLATPLIPTARAEIDLDALLHTRYMLEGEAAGPVWQFRARPGKRLVKIPVSLLPGEADYHVGTTDVRLAGGRLLAWQLAELDRPSGADRYAPSPAQEMNESLPSGAPIFARDFIVGRDGRLTYRLAYDLPGGKVKADPSNPYCLKLDAALAKMARPTKASSQTKPGETVAQQAARAADDVAAYRAAMEAYRSRMTASREVATEFSGRLPSRVWAICEVDIMQPQLRIMLPDQPQWELAAGDLKTLWALKRPVPMERGAAPAGHTPEYYRPLLENTLAFVTTQPSHRYTSRLVASALASAGIVRYVGPGDAQHQLLMHLLAGDDALTHAILGEQLDRVAGLAMGSELMQLRLERARTLDRVAVPFERPLEQFTHALAPDLDLSAWLSPRLGLSLGRATAQR